MPDERRKAYLQAMGIELWAARQPSGQGDSSAVDDRDVGPVDPPGAMPAGSLEIAESPAPGHPVPAEPPAPAQPWVEGSHEAPPAFEVIPADAYDEPLREKDEEACAEEVLSLPRVADLDWPALAERVADCRLCGLSESRSHTVFGVGDSSARLMVIGEAPGADEDRQGEPFVGRAGQLLNAMLQAIGLRRDQVYIANVLKCRPPGNRDPHVDEVAACQPYLNRQVALIRPRLILSVGGVSAKNLLGTDLPVSRLRGRVHEYAPTGTPLMVTYHPAYLLRRPEEKGKSWKDLQQVWRLLREGEES